MHPLRECRSAWLVLILIGVSASSGCEEQLPPMVDIDTSFADLLNEATDRELCEFTYYKIRDRYNYFTREGIHVEVDKYKPEERMVILVWQTTDNIMNGGFGYAFSSRYDGDPEFNVTAEHYMKLGLDEQKQILSEARNLAPDGKLPDTPKERQAFMEELGKTEVEPYDFRFRDACATGVVEQKLAAFIREHADALSYLNQPAPKKTRTAG